MRRRTILGISITTFFFFILFFLYFKSNQKEEIVEKKIELIQNENQEDL